MKYFLIGLFVLGVVLGATAPASAGLYSVSVGYADNLRADPFFPNPWQGSPNTIFVGAAPAGFDAGAIMITNTSALPIVINDVTVNNFRDGSSYDLWGSNVIGVGQSLILTQTTSYNFDTSDNSAGGTPGSPSLNVPQVIITADGGTPQAFGDTGHVLDTGGFDLALYPSAKPGDPSGNESLNWRLIGTTGVGNPGGGSAVPEPASLTLFGLGTLGLLGYGWRRRKQTVATP
jgi:hypothetical protein